ncbi:alpha amylase C-terminal domain-containing protein [Actinoplanes sp. NEAU-A12]|uniref:1,4-alpha-glucan branching enzyme n=1 Tax=Actinoplanes sandaracinus TaxID=3045177 RepID=A0ABT6WK71_9ACTN|nr:alpha amylase C-terminal domain-containing protein [Actinoplanes sandaracinus]MDI6100113.1 alpha amylase C-terminal domain-containing protein [Actinoplanes sandaracinus]
MAASQEHITAGTPRGVTMVDGGVTFRFWAPAAQRVYVSFHGVFTYDPDPADELVRDPETGDWTGFFAGVGAGTKYRFYVVGAGGEGFKRDPRARELELHGYPDCDALVVDDSTYPWHDEDWSSPAFADLIVYQLHIGVFSATDPRGRDRRAHRTAKLLDAVQKVPYLRNLGVTAIQPLPVVEFQGEWSLGYNGTDLFSPEMDYCVDPHALAPYLDAVNDLLAAKGAGPLKHEELAGQVNQLKAFVDICHLYGIAVIFDVVYNHAGGGLDPQSIDYIDLPEHPGPFNNAYFSAEGWAGGRVFAFQKPEVREFLIANALMFLEDYHADGLRFDEVSVIDAKGGWGFCQELTAVLGERAPSAALIAEYWGEHRWLAVQPRPHGMGFALGYSDRLREAVRGVIATAAAGGHGPVGIGRLTGGLHRTAHVGEAWRAYHCVENHDLALDADDHRAPRIARLADSSDPRSWYARSRSRIATGLLMTAPGVPMIFMGQEFLEDKLWSDSPGRSDRLIWWDGAFSDDRHMADFLRFSRDVIGLRRSLPALRSEGLNVFSADEDNRLLAFHRWVPGEGRDVVVVLTLSERTLHGYRLGLPRPGRWREVFNSDYYDHFPNPRVAGNAGAVVAAGPAMHGLDQSAVLTVPANGLLVLSAS